MQRNLDLLRAILLRVEESTDIHTGLKSFVDLETKYSENEIVGHVELLLDGGLVKGSLTLGTGGCYAMNIKRLTNSGFDYLDSVRDPKIWNDTKQSLAKAGGSASLAIVQATATALFKTALAKAGIDIL